MGRGYALSVESVRPLTHRIELATCNREDPTPVVKLDCEYRSRDAVRPDCAPYMN